MGLKGPYKKSFQLEASQGVPGRHGLTMRPDAERFKADANWAKKWSRYYEKLAKEEILEGTKRPTPNVRMMLAFRKMHVDIKARLLLTDKAPTKASKWEGMITSA